MMKRVLLMGLVTLLGLMPLGSLAAQESDKKPLVFRCQATFGNLLEEKLCKALLDGLNEYDGFYKPDSNLQDTSLFVDVNPLQDNEAVNIGAGFTVSVLIQGDNDTVIGLTFITATILTDKDRVGLKSWAPFWDVVYNTSDGMIEEGIGVSRAFCGSGNKKGLYAWTKTSTCASTTTAPPGGSASDTPLAR